MKKIVTTLAFAFSVYVTNAQIITTIAGNGHTSYSGDGGPATSARLDNPISVAIDASGNIFTAEAGNHIIRKINTAGIISTFAGNGTAGYSGDGAQAINSQLNSPQGIAIDISGNLYFSDDSTHVVRMINTAGIITTIAGNGTYGNVGNNGQATSATLGSPAGLAFDASGNMYIADYSYGVIRMINTSGIISTIAGVDTNGYSGNGGQATSAKLNQPFSITTDASGNLYIAERGNMVIRKINSTGIISTVAGVASYGYSGDGGLANAAKLAYPDGVAIDAAGNIYIADKDNSVIRMVNTAGVITTIAGNNTNGYSGDGGFATDAQLGYIGGLLIDNIGNLYIPDMENDLIRMINTNGIISTVAGTKNMAAIGGSAISSNLNNPTAVAVDAVGNMYIADQANSVVFKVNNAGIISTVAGNGTNGFSGDGGQATAAQLFYPAGITLDAVGNLYIADGANNVIRMVNSSGIINTVVGSNMVGYSGDGGLATAAKLSNPKGLAFDATGNLYIADNDNNVIRMVNTAGIISTIVGNDTAGYTGDGGSATDAKLAGPSGITADVNGNLFIVDEDNNVIRMVNTAGIITTVAGNGITGYSGDGGLATNAQLGYLSGGITLDQQGNLYIADQQQIIRMINTSGIISTVVGNNTSGYSGDGGLAVAASLYQPGGITTDVKGNLYVTDMHNKRVRYVSATLTEITVNSPTICAKDSTSLTANGSASYTYNWSPATGLSSTTGIHVLASPSATTSYTLNISNVFNAYGVQQTSLGMDTTRVTVKNLPTVNATSNITTLCTGNSATLTATGANTYTWNTSDTGINIVVTPTITTSYTVTGTGMNGCNNISVVAQTVSSCSTDIEQNKIDNIFTVYPNPSKGLFVVNTFKNTKVILITDILGNELLSVNPKNNTTNIDLGIQPNGIYFVKVISDNAQSTVKRIIINN